MNKTMIKGVFIAAAGVVAAGLAMHYGKDLPILGDARRGFDV